MDNITIRKVGDKFVLHMNGHDQECDIRQPKGWDPTVFLPDNPCERKLVNVPMLERTIAAKGVYVLKPKAQRTKGQTQTRTSSRTNVVDVDEWEYIPSANVPARV